MSNQFSPWPSFTKEEANIIQKILLSNKVNYWTGTECRDFEREYANWSDSKYAVALSNGTVALDAALKALDIGEGDEVIVTSRSYIASVTSIVNSSATPIFADVDLDSQNLSYKTINPVITDKTKAILCVHLAGWPCDMEEIMALANEHNLFVIEDCSQAHGAKYKGKSVGSIGHIGCWSFCQDKIITTGGEGGMVTTNNKVLWKKVWEYKDHGKSYEAVSKQKQSQGFRWLHESFGTNGRMTEIQAGIGMFQLKRMKDWQRKRINNANTIWNAAKQCELLRAPVIPKHIEHAAYKCYVFVEGSSELRDKILMQINKKGVPCYSGSCSEIYLEKVFDNSDIRPNYRLPNAKVLGETSLMFLVHPTLTKKEIQKTCDVLIDVAVSNYG